MKHIKLLIISITLIIVAVSVIFYFNNQNNSLLNSKLPENLFNQFGCGRNTLDLRGTDKYCYDYNLYKKDHAAGLI
jgi:hypothetical protein